MGDRDSSDPAREEYPLILRAAAWVGKTLVATLAVALWGAYQHQVGFRLGVDTSLCAMRVAISTGEAPRTLAECRARETPPPHPERD